MQTNLKEIIKKHPALSIVLAKTTLRRGVQFFVVILLLLAAWQFYHFAEYLQTGDSSTSVPNRPPVAEGFLPIAAIVALKSFLGAGQFDSIHPAGLVILMVTLATAWIFRRALCAWICPIGTLSEYLGKLGQKILGRQLTLPKWLDGILITLKYIIFLFIAYAFLGLSADAATQFMQAPFYAISDLKMFEFFLNISTTAIIVITFLVILSIFIKSFWCRYLCPYGALLGILGLLSPVVLTKNDATCIKCNQCNKVCPNKVDVQAKQRFVASTECTGCTSCVTACPQKETLQFKLFGVLLVKPIIFSIAFLVIFFGAIILAQLTGHWQSTLTIDQYRIFNQATTGF